MKKTNFFTKMFWILALLAASSLVLTSCDGDDHDPNNGGGGNDNPGIGAPTATTDPGVEIGGIVWATRNVDRPGTFAANPEEAGMFYQWNKRVGWSSTDPMINSNGGTSWDYFSATGTSWVSANCPCPPGWRVPTNAELNNLRNQPNTWVTNWNNTGVNGRVFGTATNRIFLRAAGWRRGHSGHAGNGRLSEVWGGSYWSSTQSGSYNARSLWFQSDYSVTYNNMRSHGRSVRCVSDN